MIKSCIRKYTEKSTICLLTIVTFASAFICYFCYILKRILKRIMKRA